MINKNQIKNSIIKVSYITGGTTKMFYLIREDMLKKEMLETEGFNFKFEPWPHSYGPPIKQHVPDLESADWDNP